MNNLLKEVKKCMENGSQFSAVNACEFYFEDRKFRKYTCIYTTGEARRVILNKIYHEFDNQSLKKNKINELMNKLQFVNNYKNIYLVYFNHDFTPLNFEYLKQNIIQAM